MVIRYYKGKFKVKRLTGASPTKTALYIALEDAENWKRGETIVIPFRLCHKKRKEDDNVH